MQKRKRIGASSVDKGPFSTQPQQLPCPFTQVLPVTPILWDRTCTCIFLSTLYIYSNIMLHTHYDRFWHELFESVAITGSFFSNVGFKQQNIIVMWVNCFSKRVELPTGLFGLTLSVVHYQLLTALLFQLVQRLCFIHLNSKCCFEPTCSMY